MGEPIFYVVEIDPPAEALPDFAAWYAGVHAPHLFHAGFTNCTSYVGVSGTMRVVDIYQSDGWAMFERPAFARYRGIAAADPQRPAAIKGLRNSRTVYHHHPATPLPGRDPAAPLDSDWIAILRFDGDAALEAQAASWLAEGGAARLEEAGARSLRLLHRGRDAPTGPSIRPALALVTEWAVRPPEPEALRPLLPHPLAAAIAAAEGFVGWRLYPWAMDPALRLATAPQPAGAAA